MKKNILIIMAILLLIIPTALAVLFPTPDNPCIDTDGGKDYYTDGEWAYSSDTGGGSGSDRCIDDNVLREYYCENDVITHEDYTCPGGCVMFEGVCEVVTVCTEDWSCGDWSDCTGDAQTRTCTDANSCGTTDDKPSTSQSCTVTCTEDWDCDDWSSCVDNKQTRSCTDQNDCDTTDDKPSTRRDCAMCETNSECDDGKVSTKDRCSGSPKKCSNTVITDCFSGDDYCPSGCSSQGDDDCDQCSSDQDCNDNNACTSDSCSGSPARCANTRESSGCSFQNSCLTIGTRTTNLYCGSDNIMEKHKSLTSSCSNNYECQTNLCKNNQCSESSLIKRIINWFKSLFGAGDSNETHADVKSLVDCGEDKACFEEEFKNCNPAKVKMGLELAPGANLLYLYEIIKLSNEGCEVKSQFLENPMPGFVGKTMICKYDNALDFESAVADTSKCQGELYDQLNAG